MKERILQEIALLKGKYPNLQHGENHDWIMISDYALPEGYNRKATRVLFLIPPTYPHTPPDNFYVDSGLKFGNGNPLTNYGEGSAIPFGGAWGRFSWHPEEWQSAPDVKSGDNLLTFVRSISIRLREMI